MGEHLEQKGKVSTLMVSKAKSRTAHCFGVRFLVSSRTMWSWNPEKTVSEKSRAVISAVPSPARSKIALTLVVLSPTSGPQAPSLQPHGPHIPRTLSLESWLSSLAAVKISWVPWAERDQSKVED